MRISSGVGGTARQHADYVGGYFGAMVASCEKIGETHHDLIRNPRPASPWCTRDLLSPNRRLSAMGPKT